jgi:signal transduction histidine kinase
VERIASAHGGVLRLENRDGGGLRACIRLPANG